MGVLKRNDLVYPELSYKIVGIAYDVYNELGEGHHEKYYQLALAEGFRNSGVIFREQVHFPMKYKEKTIGRNYLDFVVDNKIVVEIKKGNKFSKRHIDQVLRYLKISGLKLALLINFASEGVMFKRIINIT